MHILLGPCRSINSVGLVSVALKRCWSAYVTACSSAAFIQAYWAECYLQAGKQHVKESGWAFAWVAACWR